VANILILSTNLYQAGQWSAALSEEHGVNCVDKIESAVDFIQQKSASGIIIDAEFFDVEGIDLSVFRSYGLKTLIIGRKWPEERQIDALIAGYSGYCETDAAHEHILKAANSILKGDIWIQRHLVPKVIGILVNLNSSRPYQPKNKKIEFEKNLQTLTHREMDVAKMISSGESNKMIASLLNISERTVKAHLTSIFQKLNVPDRLHLALLFKENY
jgi:DNA-binding NarL/FixJ family response regulator